MIDRLVSFATLDTGYRMPEAHRRYTRQIDFLKKEGLLGDGRILSDRTISPAWKSRYADFLPDHAYAYWSWKPYIIMDALSAVPDGGTLLYIDGGCVLPDGDELKRLASFLDGLKPEISKYGGVALTAYDYVPDAFIVRREVTDRFGLSDDSNFLYHFPHWQAGIVLLVKNEATERLVYDWNSFIWDNYEDCLHFHFNDKSGQVKGFIHNGADQAILQCLLYKMGMTPFNINDPMLRYYQRFRR